MLRRGTVSTLRALAATGLLTVAAEHAGAQSASLTVESIDVYGSAAFDSAAIRAEFEADIMRYVAAMEQMRALKQAFDPAGLLNPGKVVPTLNRCAEYGKMLVRGGRIAHPDLPRY